MLRKVGKLIVVQVKLLRKVLKFNDDMGGKSLRKFSKFRVNMTNKN